ncbi:MAG: Spy/CpxP family protein refolding chaperone [Limnothrix sp.]
MFQRHFLFATVTALSFSSAGVAIAESVPTTETLSTTNTTTLLARGGAQKDALLASLNLSTSQKQQIQTIKNSYQSQMGAQKSTMRQAYEIMKNLMANGNTSRSQLESQHRTIASLRREVADLHFRQMMDIREVLTPAQRETMAQHMLQYMNSNKDLTWRK